MFYVAYFYVLCGIVLCSMWDISIVLLGYFYVLCGIFLCYMWDISVFYVGFNVTVKAGRCTGGEEAVRRAATDHQ